MESGFIASYLRRFFELEQEHQPPS